MEHLAGLAGALLFFAIGAAISRWIFRINDIVNRLDDIKKLLEKNDIKGK